MKPAVTMPALGEANSAHLGQVCLLAQERTCIIHLLSPRPTTPETGQVDPPTLMCSVAAADRHKSAKSGSRVYCS